MIQSNPWDRLLRIPMRPYNYQCAAADGAGIPVFHGMLSSQPAPLLSFSVRVRHDVVAVTVMHLGESDITCGAARSILPGRASHEVRSFRNNVASSARMATHP